MPTTAGGVQARKIMNNKCSSECHQSSQSVFMRAGKLLQPVAFQIIFTQWTKKLSSSLLQPSRFPIKDNNSTGNEEEPKVLWLLKREETPEKY